MVVGGIQSLEPGSGDGSFDSSRKELLCIFLLFLSDNALPPPPCDKDTSEGPFGGDLCPSRRPGSVICFLKGRDL